MIRFGPKLIMFHESERKITTLTLGIKFLPPDTHHTIVFLDTGCWIPSVTDNMNMYPDLSRNSLERISEHSQVSYIFIALIDHKSYFKTHDKLYDYHKATN